MTFAFFTTAVKTDSKGKIITGPNERPGKEHRRPGSRR